MHTSPARPASKLRFGQRDRDIFTLAVPALGALIAEPLFLLVDTAMIGHLGAEQLAGVGIGTAVLHTVVGLLIFLAYATTPIVARRLGFGDRPGAIRAGIDGIWLAVAVGTLLLPSFFLAPNIVAMFGATAAVTEHAATYLSISILGMPGMLIVFAATGLLRGLQNTKIPLLVSGLGFVANAGLNALLIYGIGLGVAGSAIGTVIAQWGMALIFIAVAVRAARAEGVSLRPGFAGVRLAAGSGGWLFLRTLTLRIALLTTVVVATDRGTEVLAATQIVFTIFSTLGFAHDALAIAGQAMVGKALGANDAAEARAINTRLLQWGILIGIAVAIPLVAASSVIGAIFTGDSAVQSLVMPGLILLALAQPIFAIVCVLDGVLIGSGDARYLAIVGVINLLVYLPLLWITEWAQLEGSEAMIAIWGAFAFGYLLARACTLWFRVRTDRWLVVGHSR